MAAHPGAADEKSPTWEPERTAVRQVDEVTRKVGQAFAEDTSSHGRKHVRGTLDSRWSRGRLGESQRRRPQHTADIEGEQPIQTLGVVKQFFSEPSFSDVVHHQS